MLKNIYNQKVTILNKLRRGDGTSSLDVWYKYVVDGVAWYTDSARSAGGTSVYIGTYVTVLFPFNLETQYVPYLEWKTLPENGRVNCFTMSNQDYIILGDIEETDITAANVIEVVKRYGENVCQVKHHNEAYYRFGARVQLKVEGV